jgi:activator of HSP90 ATPase
VAPKKVGKKAAAKKAPKKVAKKAAPKTAGKKAAAKKAPKKVAKRAAPKKKLAKKVSSVAVAQPRERLALSTVLPAAPEAVIAAWLDSAAHSAFTGAEATIDGFEGGRHSAWSGYIEGRFVTVHPTRLVMTWRTTEFAPTDPDSRLEVSAEPASGGTRLSVVHTDLPVGGAEKYGRGWRDFYFKPMAAYFQG